MATIQWPENTGITRILYGILSRTQHLVGMRPIPPLLQSSKRGRFTGVGTCASTTKSSEGAWLPKFYRPWAVDPSELEGRRNPKSKTPARGEPNGGALKLAAAVPSLGLVAKHKKVGP